MFHKEASVMLLAFSDELEKIAANTMVGNIMQAAHHGIEPEALAALPAFKQFKNVTRAKNHEAVQRIGQNLTDQLKNQAKTVTAALRKRAYDLDTSGMSEALKKRVTGGPSKFAPPGLITKAQNVAAHTPTAAAAGGFLSKLLKR